MTLNDFKDRHSEVKHETNSFLMLDENNTNISEGVIENCVKVNLRSSPEPGLNSIITAVDCGVHVNIYPNKSVDKYWFVKTMDNEGFIDKRYVKVS